MWVVYSLDPRLDLKPGDLRRELIEHSEDPSTKLRALQQAERRAESELERQVLRYLVQANHRVRTQWQVGHYRIDLVVEGDGKRLAIECDGDRWHPPEKLAEDLERQAGELLNRVLSRADELRREWLDSGSGLAPVS